MKPILMPKPGQMTEECTVTLWQKQEGDPVRRGDVLFEIETDKATMEVESFVEGTLLRIVAPEGATVPVNAVCAWVGEPGEAIPEDPSVPPSAATPASSPAPAQAPAPSTTAPDRSAVRPTSDRLRISPRAARLAAELGVDPRAVTGTGPEGRIVERDVRATAAPSATRPVSPAAASAAPASADDDEAPRPLSRMRRVIAERLTESWTSIPQFTITVAADVTGLLALRAELKASGSPVTVTDFVLAAVAQTLVEFPDVNARTDGTSVWPRRRVHLGLAVAIPGGLVVPVLRDADRASLSDLHERAADLAARARAGSLDIDEMTGSTFTVSNLGMHGVEAFSAIINPGESAILAVAAALPTPVAIGDGIAVRTLMRLTLSADHRLVDGELGARFLGALRRRLEDVQGLRWEANVG